MKGLKFVWCFSQGDRVSSHNEVTDVFIDATNRDCNTISKSTVYRTVPKIWRTLVKQSLNETDKITKREVVQLSNPKPLQFNLRY